MKNTKKEKFTQVNYYVTNDKYNGAAQHMSTRLDGHLTVRGAQRILRREEETAVVTYVAHAYYV